MTKQEQKQRVMRVLTAAEIYPTSKYDRELLASRILDALGVVAEPEQPEDVTIWRIGDKFVFDVESMRENGVGTDSKDGETVYPVLAVEHHPHLGQIITYRFMDGFPVAQVNACWVKKV